MAEANPVKGIHFVGSVPLNTVDSVLHRLTSDFPASLLPRIPDGETGQYRSTWIVCQRKVFSKCPPGAIVNFDWQPSEVISHPPPDDADIPIADMVYDTAAIASYQDFCKLREQGKIKAGQRFMVAVPTPTNVIMYMAMPNWKLALERAYTREFKRALRHIQDVIPAEDLAFQWDIPGELCYMEGMAPMEHWWNGRLWDGLLERAVGVMSCIDKAIPMGLHLCYGDQWHQHFMQPRDLGVIVDLANALIETCPRSIDFLHMPVPRDRTDRAYFAPLARLRAPHSELIMGLLHAEKDATEIRKRIAAAREFVPRFLIASECGYGRCTVPEWERQMQIARQIMGLSAPGKDRARL